MGILNPEIDIDSFFTYLAKSIINALLLDYDGTLAPFKVKRDEARPYPGITEILNSIIDSGNCYLAIISGRPVDEVAGLLKLRQQPEIWGAHGWELRQPDGSYIAFEVDKVNLQGFNEAKSWIERQGYQNRCEYKHGSMALHWRGLKSEEADLIHQAATDSWLPIARKYGLTIRNFDGGIELRAPGRTKGDAVRNIIERANSDIAAYLGDDLTDEDAFKALGSAGLKVLVNKYLRQTSADLWLKPPDELIAFLERWRDSISIAKS